MIEIMSSFLSYYKILAVFYHLIGLQCSYYVFIIISLSLKIIEIYFFAINLLAITLVVCLYLIVFSFTDFVH